MRFIFICMLVMFAFIGLGQAAMSGGAPHIAIGLWCFAMLAIGLLFYRLRLRSRLWYGGFELLIALAASYFVLLNLYQHAAGLAVQTLIGRIIILFAAVYVMVRALDNVGQALRPHWRVTEKWQRLFR